VPDHLGRREPHPGNAVAAYSRGKGGSSGEVRGIARSGCRRLSRRNLGKLAPEWLFSPQFGFQFHARADTILGSWFDDAIAASALLLDRPASFSSPAHLADHQVGPFHFGPESVHRGRLCPESRTVRRRVVSWVRSFMSET
jgi:hypothetical protein